MESDNAPYKFTREEVRRHVYRSLLNRGRAYAAFIEKKIDPLLTNLSDSDCILDPMAGYGTIMRMCSQRGLKSYSNELNPPSYYWMILRNPAYIDSFIPLLECLLEARMPTFSKVFMFTDDWFASDCQKLLHELYRSICKIALGFFNSDMVEKAAIAVLLPFIGYFSSFSEGTLFTSVKRGGLCVVRDWKAALQTYFSKLHSLLAYSRLAYVEREQMVVYGDARTCRFPRKFERFITSPPYPNRVDYRSMFGPENAFIQLLCKEETSNAIYPSSLIGDNSVSKFKGQIEDDSKYGSFLLSSPTAIEFIDFIKNYKGKTQKVARDNKLYYVPYYMKYFMNLEKAYSNLADALSKNAIGYIIVVDNTARNKVIPLCQFTIEVFEAMGFNAQIMREYSTEQSHSGSINPRVKGFRAKHMEYTIKIEGGA